MKIRSKVFITYLLFILVYALISLLPTPPALTLHKYHLHPTGARLLDFTVIAPLFGIWFAAFYGYDKLHRYSQLIKKNRDGKQVARLACGLLALAIGLPLESIVSSILKLIAQTHPSFAGLAIIVPHYIDVIYILIAFLFISAGMRGLSRISHSRPSVLVGHGVILIVIISGVIFCNLIARAHDQNTVPVTYHMSYSLVMLTLAIPYMYIWFLGLSSISETYEYSKHVGGIVYRKGWNRLAFGLGAIILLNILLQYLGTLYSWLNDLSLAGLLTLLYVLLFLMAGGFIVVALGARDLMKIEEV